MKPADVKIKTYINFVVNQNKINSKFKIGDHVQIFKYKSKFSEVYVPNQSEDVFIIKEITDTTLWAHKNCMLDGQVAVVYLTVRLTNQIYLKNYC